MAGDDENLFWLEGQPKPASETEMNWAIHYVVGPDYLKVMDIPLRRGRFITREDNERSPRVAVIDDVFGGKYFPNQDPIGRRIHLNGSDQLTQIIGIVGHVKQWGLDADDTNSLRAQFYVPCMQMPDRYIASAPSGAGMVVRSSGADASLIDAIRRASVQMSNQQVIYGMQTMDELITESLASQRFSMILLGVFALLALVLASVGIYGVMSYSVAQRTREIGIRMARGARRADVLQMTVGQGLKLVGAGMILGLGAAFLLTRVMATLLYGISATDPITFVSISLVLLAVATLASYVPALRATRVDPIVALRAQ